jgi:hypothetical protein
MARAFFADPNARLSSAPIFVAAQSSPYFFTLWINAMLQISAGDLGEKRPFLSRSTV